jgi:hypothetical protein
MSRAIFLSALTTIAEIDPDVVGYLDTLLTVRSSEGETTSRFGSFVIASSSQNRVARANAALWA